MALNPSDLAAIQSFLQVVTDSNWPGHRGGELRVRTADGHKAIIPIPVYRPPIARRYTPDDDDGLTEMERDILQAVAEGRGEPMTAEAISEKAGYDCTTRFKELLSSLVRRSRLSRAPGRSGYIPPAA